MGHRILSLLPALSLAFVLHPAFASEEPEKAIAEELKRLDGEWKIVAAEQGGSAIECNDLVVFSGRKGSVTNPVTKIVLRTPSRSIPPKLPSESR